MTDRTLLWDGAINARDLGGLPLEDGGETRRGAVVRSAGLGRLTEAGWRALTDYGVRTIVDLRCPTEHDDLPGAAVDVVHTPLFRQDDEGFRAEMAGCASWLSFYELVVSTRAHGIASAVGAVADAPDGGVLVHCLAGKDRTGIVAGFLLALAGVPDDAIAEDYSVSESSLRLIFERPEEATCEPETILAVLAGMRARHGSLREYLLAAGATEAQLDRVRTRLRTSP